MVDGYVYMALLCAYTGISRQDIYIYIYITFKCPKHPLCEKPVCAVKNTDGLRWWLLENVLDYSPNVSWDINGI